MCFAFSESIRFDRRSDAGTAALICSSVDKRVSIQTIAHVRRCFETNGSQLARPTILESPKSRPASDFFLA